MNTTNINTKQVDLLLFTEQNSEEELFAPLTALFVNRLGALYELATDEHIDMNDLERMAHSLKALSAQLGLKGTEALCLSLETKSKFREPEHWELWADRVRQIGLEEVSELKLYLTARHKSEPKAA